MGLDVYVGTLTRYYTRDWETIIQKTGREQGIKVEIVTPGAPEVPLDDRLSADETRELVENWRSELAEDLKEHLPAGLTWSEDDSEPYFTDKPGWEGYAGLVLWAAYAEAPDLRRPMRAPADWETDPAYLRASQNESTRFPNLVRGAEFWLPGEADILFGGYEPVGKEVAFGFVLDLLGELDMLNSMTWNASAEKLADWRAITDRWNELFETTARVGFSIVWGLALEAQRHGLPMKLDY